MINETWHISEHTDNYNIIVRNEKREIVADFQTDETVKKQKALERAALVALAPQMLQLLRQLEKETQSCRIRDLLSELDKASKPQKHAIWCNNGETSEVVEIEEFLSTEDAKSYANGFWLDSEDYDNEYWAELAD